MECLSGYAKGSESYKPYAVMLFIQLVYAGMAVLSKAATAQGVNPFVFVAYRQALATLVLAPFAFFFERNKASPLTFNLLCEIFLVSLSGPTLGQNLYYVAINYTSATFAAAATNTIPAITFIMALLLRMESMSLKHWHGLAKAGGTVMGISGALIFAFVEGAPLKFLKSDRTLQRETYRPSDFHSSKWELLKGPLMMLSANTVWSLWLILQGTIVKRYPSKLRLTTLQCLFSCIQSTVWAFSMKRDLSSWKLGWNINLVSVAYCGVIVTGMTYWLQVWVIEKKGAVFTAIFTPLTLLITAIFSAVCWKETLYWGSVGGAVFLVGGLYSVLWGKNKEDECEKKENAQQEAKVEVILVVCDNTTLD